MKCSYMEQNHHSFLIWILTLHYHFINWSLLRKKTIVRRPNRTFINVIYKTEAKSNGNEEAHFPLPTSHVFRSTHNKHSHRHRKVTIVETGFHRPSLPPRPHSPPWQSSCATLCRCVPTILCQGPRPFPNEHCRPTFLPS